MSFIPQILTGKTMRCQVSCFSDAERPATDTGGGCPSYIRSLQTPCHVEVRAEESGKILPGKDVCSDAMVPLRNKQIILSGRSLIGDITLDLSLGRNIRSFQEERKEGGKVIPSRENSLWKRLVNDHVMKTFGRSGNEE